MQIVGGLQRDPNTYISVTAVNLGDRATTITNLGFLYYRSWLKAKLRWNKPDRAFIIASPSQAQVIPYRFEPGAKWIGLAHQDDDVMQMIKEGYLFVVLYHSHGGEGIRHRVTLKQAPLRQAE
jgi:predicted MPP superfamily phosphohydrolase